LICKGVATYSCILSWQESRVQINIPPLQAACDLVRTGYICCTKTISMIWFIWPSPYEAHLSPSKKKIDMQRTVKRHFFFHTGLHSACPSLFWCCIGLIPTLVSGMLQLASPWMCNLSFHRRHTECWDYFVLYASPISSVSHVHKITKA
jgi:hypothetical protein